MAGSIFASSVDGLNNAVKAAFRDSFSRAQDNLPWRDLATDLGKSTAKSTSLDWLGNTPDMAEKTRDDAHFGGMGRYSYTIIHKVYQANLAVRLTDLETDLQSQIRPRIDDLARKAVGHPGRLMFDQLESNPTIYDSTAWFANTRTFGAAANIDNLAAGSGTTAADIEADLATIRATMMRFEDDKGEPMELSPNVLIIPPDLSLAFGKVLGPTRQAGGDTLQLGVSAPGMGNVWRAGGYTVYELARLTDTNNWYALHTGEALNPFVFSWVTMPTILNTPSTNDASAINSDELHYAVRGYYNVGVSLAHYAVSVVN